MSKFTLSTISLLAVLACTNAAAEIYFFDPKGIAFSKKEWTTETDNPKFFINFYENGGGFEVENPHPPLNLANCTFSKNVLKFSTETPPTEDTGLVIIDTNEARKLPRGPNEIEISCDTFVMGSRNYPGRGFKLEPSKITANFTIHNTYPDLTRAVARIDDSNRSAIKLNITRPQSDVSTSRGVNYWIAALVPGRIFGVAEDQLFFLTQNTSGSSEWKQLNSGDALSVAYLKNQSAANHADEITVNFGFSKEEMASLNANIFFAYQIDGQEIKILDYAWNPAVTTPVASNYTSIHKLYAYETLNKVREITGFGYLKPVAALNNAAQAHIDYLKANNTSGHSEIQGFSGFTGVNPGDRMRYFGYGDGADFGGGESVSAGSSSLKTIVWSLLGVPYHSVFLLDNATDVGFGYNSGLVVNTGFKLNPYPQDMAVNEIKVYPCNNIKVDVTRQGYESPNPAPLNGKQDFGYTSIAKIRSGQLLTVDSWELRDANNALVNTVLMTKNNDTTMMFGPHMAALIPLNPLPVIATSYTSVLRGKNNGVPFEKVCTWRTVGEGEIAAN